MKRATPIHLHIHTQHTHTHTHTGRQTLTTPIHIFTKGIGIDRGETQDFAHPTSSFSFQREKGPDTVSLVREAACACMDVCVCVCVCV
jgi:hypothetical protein